MGVQRSAEGSRRGLRVGGLGDRPDHDRAPSARADRVPDRQLVEPADREPRDGCVGGGVADRIEPGRGPAGLGGRLVNRTDRDVVDALGGVDLRRRVCREPHEPIVAHEHARPGDRDVVLAHVDAVGLARRDEVGPVVEDEQRAVSVARFTEVAGCGDEPVVVEALVAKLDDVHAPGQGSVQEARRAGVAHEVEPRSREVPSALVVHARSVPGATTIGGNQREPAHGLRGRHRAADRPNLIRVMPAQGANTVNPASPKPRHDAVVIGAGAIGLAVAWRAAQRGLRVLVLERERIGAGASHVAAGMLAPVTEATFGEERLTELGLASAARWPRFARELGEASGLDPSLRACGTLVVARDRDEAEALDREIVFRRSLGLAADRLLGSEARRLEPALAPTIRLALHAPDDHAVDPRRLTAALAAACAREGVEVREGVAVGEVVIEGGEVTGVGVADARGSGSVPVAGEAASFVAAGTVVVAAGSWSGALPGVPERARVPVRPVKGQVLRLRDPEGPGLLHRSLRMDTGLRSGYLVPRGDGRYVLGATVEERGYDTSITAGALHDLVHDAAELLPGVLELELEEAIAGLRPGTPDNAPVIGPAAVGGLVWATGHYRNGILLAPLTADAVAAMLVGEEPRAKIDAADPRRFAARGAAAAGTRSPLSDARPTPSDRTPLSGARR